MTMSFLGIVGVDNDPSMNCRVYLGEGEAGVVMFALRATVEEGKFGDESFRVAGPEKIQQRGVN